MRSAGRVASWLFELAVAVGATLFGFVAIMGSLDDTADLSVAGFLIALGALGLALVSYGRPRERHLLIAGLIVASAAFSTADLILSGPWGS